MSKTNDNTEANTPASPLAEGTTRSDAGDNSDIFAELERKKKDGGLPQIKREPTTDIMSDGTVRTMR